MSLIHAAKLDTTQLQISAIVCLTETGATAKFLARFREAPPIYALTPSPEAYHRLSLVYGVEAIMVDFPSKELQNEEIVTKILELGIAKSGETILVVHGTFWRDPGMTNTLKVVLLP
jgi:pyruvate kinase